MENPNAPATSRQRWALYLITKKDYRDVELTKQEAADLIKELGDPNYKKGKDPNCKKDKDLNCKKDKPARTSSTLASKLEEYMVDHFEEIWRACTESMGIKSIIEEDKSNGPDRKRFAMIGVGCSISYFKYRKNNKKAKEIAETGKKLIRGKIEDMFIARFTKDERKYYERIGCPLEAIFSQDGNIQSQCYYLVVKFAETQGIKMDYETRLD